jgi:excisionase family DNA binding protein
MAQWLDLDDLSGYLKKPKSTLYKLVERGQIPGHKVGRNWRFDRDEVDAFIKKGALGRNGRKRRK